jgi:hypothetical protein
VTLTTHRDGDMSVLVLHGTTGRAGVAYSRSVSALSSHLSMKRFTLSVFSSRMTLYRGMEVDADRAAALLATC